MVHFLGLDIASNSLNILSRNESYMERFSGNLRRFTVSVLPAVVTRVNSRHAPLESINNVTPVEETATTNPSFGAAHITI